MFPARRVRRARESNEVVTEVPADADDGGASASTVRTYVLLVPTHDDAVVIGDTLRSLLELPEDRTHVLVVDDCSSDDTATVALTYPRDRVTVIQRQPPHARRGRGASVAAGMRMVRRMSLGDPSAVAVGVLAAEASVGPGLVSELDRRFADGSLVGTRLDTRDPAGSGRRPRRERELRSVPADARAGLAWVARGQGRFIRLAALLDAPDRPSAPDRPQRPVAPKRPDGPGGPGGRV